MPWYKKTWVKVLGAIFVVYFILHAPHEAADTANTGVSKVKGGADSVVTFLGDLKFGQ